MRLVGRDIRKVGKAFFNPDHYRALTKTAVVHTNPVEAWRRYVTATGSYPWRPTVRTPVGLVTPTLNGHQDVLTLNEIFCRNDYGKGGQRVVVDLGANVGLATLFFLTRRPDSVVYAAEPIPSNLERLRVNLAPYEGRWFLDERAVTPHESGTADFLTEQTGRLGGLTEFSRREGSTITVDTVNIGEFLEPVLSERGRIELLKVDTEGSEKPLIEAIPADQRARIDAIVWEQAGGVVWA